MGNNNDPFFAYRLPQPGFSAYAEASSSGRCGEKTIIQPKYDRKPHVLIHDISVWVLREGVGNATNNVAEYRAMILGLRTALHKGFKQADVRGDSALICNQMMGKWVTKNEMMCNLYREAFHLIKQFLYVTIQQVPKELNSAANAQAKRATNLRCGQIEIEMPNSQP